MQRFFDILFSAIAIIILSPLLLPVIIILRLTGEGNIFYIQERIGKGKKEFGLLKFATMLKNSPNMATGDITVKYDPRVLPFGRFLRKSKINELPQLINILIGDMSIVGPRPLTKKTFMYFSNDIQDTISRIKPGLTGIGSIFFRDEESLLDGKNNRLDFYEKFISPYKGALEKWYVEHQSIYNYFMIIIITAWVVIFPSRNILERFFRNLPKPPDELKI